MGLREKFIRAIVDIRIWLSYSQTWLSVATSGMILFLFLDKLNQTYAWFDNWNKIAIPVYLLIMVIMALWGWLCERFGIFAADADRQWIKTRNPHIDRIHDSLDRLEKKVGSK